MYEIKENILKPDLPIELSDFGSIYPKGGVEVKGSGNCLVLLLYSDEGGEVTIEAGDSVFAGKSLTFDLNVAMYTVIQLETGRYVKQTGADKGKIIISTEISDLICNCFQIN